MTSNTYIYSILENREKSDSLSFYYWVGENELDFLKKELKDIKEENKNKKSFTYEIVKRERGNSSNYETIKI